MGSIVLYVLHESSKRFCILDREVEDKPLRFGFSFRPSCLNSDQVREIWIGIKKSCALTRASSAIFGVYESLFPIGNVCVSCPLNYENTLAWSANPKQASFYFRNPEG